MDGSIEHLRLTAGMGPNVSGGVAQAGSATVARLATSPQLALGLGLGLGLPILLAACIYLFLRRRSVFGRVRGAHPKDQPSGGDKAGAADGRSPAATGETHSFQAPRRSGFDPRPRSRE